MAIKIPVDFTGVEARKTVRVPEGDYVAKVVLVKKQNAKTSGNPMLVVTFEGLSGELQGQRIIDRHILTKESLWTLRNMLEAMGYKVKPSKMNITDSMLMGKKVGLTIIDGDEYNGRIRSEVADYLPPSAVGNISREAEAVEDDDGDEWEDSDEDDFEESSDDDDVDDEVEEDSFDFGGDDEDDDEDEDDEDDVEGLSFDASEVSSAKGAQLKEYLKEAAEAGWEFDLPKSAKVADVRKVLLALFEDEDEDDDDSDLEGFDLDDLD